jgi:hypothetical protein
MYKYTFQCINIHWDYEPNLNLNYRYRKQIPGRASSAASRWAARTWIALRGGVGNLSLD